MKWKRTKGRNVTDIRGASRGSRSGGAGGLPLPGGLAGMGGGAGVVGLIIFLAITFIGGDSPGAGGFDVDEIFGPSAQAPGAEDASPIPPGQDPQRELFEFSSYVFTDAQKTWAGTFRSDREDYRSAELVVYRDRVSTDGCGSATSSVGPFYCPADSSIYLDLSFYEDMERQLDASGDFAWAYVIAHEMGHHVQNVSGTNAEVSQLERSAPEEANELSVRLELQADCYSGVWAATVFAEGDLEEGDLEEAFTASEAVGDDRLQQRAGGAVDPDSFTHGSSEQRREWFEKGYRSGVPSACDTFAPESV